MAEAQLTDIPGVGAVAADSLREAGVRTVLQLSRASVEQLVQVPGFGVAKATAAKTAAQGLVAAKAGRTARPRSAPSRRGGASSTPPRGSAAKTIEEGPVKAKKAKKAKKGKKGKQKTKKKDEKAKRKHKRKSSKKKK